MLKIIKFENFYNSIKINVQRANYSVAGRDILCTSFTLQETARKAPEAAMRPILSEVPESSHLVPSFLEQKNSNFVAYISVKCLLFTVQ